MKLLSFLTLAHCYPSVVGFVSQPSASRLCLGKSSATCLLAALEPLAAEGDWQAFLDEETTGLIYYFDGKTGESLWEPPTDSFPEIRLSRKQQRLADELRRNYRRGRQEDADGAAKNKAVQEPEESWIDGLFDAPVQESAAEPQKNQQRKVDWLPDIFEQQVKEVKLATVEEPAIKTSMFGILESFTSRSSEAAAVNGDKAVEEEEKSDDFTPKPIKIEMASYVLPHPAKVSWGGEDAVFTKGRTFGVFDGVSGADKLDGVPLYSVTLAQEMKKMVGNRGLSVAEMSLYLTEAAEFADICATGASTAVVASIGENGFLQALNVGDSYCVVIRGGRVTAKTREISHYWECPYQLSEDSPDRPKDGTKLNVELVAGDLVLMGSDGIFDNVDDDALVAMVENGPRKPSQIAKRVVDLSRKMSLDPDSKTPYAKQAQKRGDRDFKDGRGGKLDDACAIVVLCK
jgi:protein phosphatase PTC7